VLFQFAQEKGCECLEDVEDLNIEEDGQAFLDFIQDRIVQADDADEDNWTAEGSLPTPEHGSLGQLYSRGQSVREENDVEDLEQEEEEEDAGLWSWQQQEERDTRRATAAPREAEEMVAATSSEDDILITGVVKVNRQPMAARPMSLHSNRRPDVKADMIAWWDDDEIIEAEEEDGIVSPDQSDIEDVVVIGETKSLNGKNTCLPAGVPLRTNALRQVGVQPRPVPSP
jgi:hypothetical protein